MLVMMEDWKRLFKLFQYKTYLRHQRMSQSVSVATANHPAHPSTTSLYHRFTTQWFQTSNTITRLISHNILSKQLVMGTHFYIGLPMSLT